jgi:xanthine/CO dehydrogenase XdhC/CoxF family maturation factor
MNFSLLDKIRDVEDGILVTVLATEGHTYKKKGAKALFACGRANAVWGNLGSLCVDQEILRHGREAFTGLKPVLVEIDTRSSDDVDFGYGTYCGGLMRVLVEPIRKSQKAVYTRLRERLEKRLHSFVEHDFDTGYLTVHDSEQPERDGVLVESFPPLQTLFLFGATPLTKHILKCVEDMEYEVHVVDWREEYLGSFRHIDGVTTHLDEYSFDEASFVLVLSHDFRRDKYVIKEALTRRCAYIGLLSSRTRRDKIFEELLDEGVEATDLQRISSPVGIDIGARSDPEIAVAIAAELVSLEER